MVNITFIDKIEPYHKNRLAIKLKNKAHHLNFTNNGVIKLYKMLGSLERIL